MQVHSLEPQLSHLRSASTPRTIGPLFLSLSLSRRPPPFARLKAAPRSIDELEDEILGVASVKLRIGGDCYSRDYVYYTAADLLVSFCLSKGKF